MDAEFWKNIVYQTMLYNLNWDMLSISQKWCMIGRDKATLELVKHAYSVTFDKPTNGHVAMMHFVDQHSQRNKIINEILTTSASIEWIIRPFNFLDDYMNKF